MFAGRFAVVGIVASIAILLWVMAVVPPLVAFVVAVALATAWCLWLEKHPEHPTGKETRPSKSDRQ